MENGGIRQCSWRLAPLTQRMMTLSAWLSISAGLAWNVKGQPQPLLKGQEPRLFFDLSSLVDQRLNSSLKLKLLCLCVSMCLCYFGDVFTF